MLAYMTAAEAAEKWGISHRRVITLCREDRIPDAAMLGNMWIIPNDAEKPVDGRTTRYDKKNPAKPFIKWAGGKGQLLPTIRKFYPPNMGVEITKYCEPMVGAGAALFIYLNKTCFNGLYRVNRKGSFNVPMGSYKNPTICDTENINKTSELLQGVTIIVGDYTSIEQYADEHTFIYFDPPYRPLTKTAEFTSYTPDSFDDDDQIKLGEFIERLLQKKVIVLLADEIKGKCNEREEKIYYHN